MKHRFHHGFVMHSFIVALGGFVVALVAAASALAQNDPKKPDTAPPPAAQKAADPKKPAAAAFDKAFTEWKGLIKEIRQLKVRYQAAPEAEHAAINDEWNALIVKGNDMLGGLQSAALEAYAESPNEDPQLMRFLVKLATDAADRDDFEAAMAISEALIAGGCGDKTIYGPASVAAFATNQYDKADQWNKLAVEAGSPSQVLGQVDLMEYKKHWEAEQEIRAKEAAQDDLPRVKMTTSQGDIVIELFEDQAPDTVGNFVSLVEAKKYDGLPFHRVLKNFMAQGGDPKGDGTGGPGYNIFCECHKPDFRYHFRGSLSMAHAGRDTGGSQFFLTFLPTPHLNKRHTCFGRVIEGLDVLAKLQKIDPMEPGKTPDKIVTAEVVRKRDHAYAPKKVE